MHPINDGLIVQVGPSRGGLEVERPLHIELKAGHSCLGGFESHLGMLYQSYGTVLTQGA